MSKQKTKVKAKGKRSQHEGQSFNEDALAHLTSKIDKSLSTSDHKRKNPPTNDPSSQAVKKRRNFRPSKSEDHEKEDYETLLAEIKALGGDEADLDLINGIDSSEDEYKNETRPPIDKKLRDELAALSKELGFANLQPAVASDDDEEPGHSESMANEDGRDDDEGADQSEDEAEPEKTSLSRRMGNMTFEPRADWHAYKLAKLPEPVTEDLGPFLRPIEALKQYAQNLLDEDANRYRTSIFASSSHKFLSTIMSSGTLTDKVSALTLAIQESPVHNIRAFDALMTLASKKSRAQAIGAIGALVDLLGPGTLLPSNRRLRTFQNQPNLLGVLQKSSIKIWSAGDSLPGKLTPEHLISWIFEDWLKATYFKIIQLLEVWCSDEIEYSRIRAVDFVYALLKDKPEQESNLLKLLVNKLGDRDKKIASRASYLLLQIQNSHPGMKPVIVRTIEQEIVLRPSQDSRSKYYAINTLNQTILSSKEPSIAESLIRIYFDLFVGMLKTGSLGIAMQHEADAAKSEAQVAERSRTRPSRRDTPKSGSAPAPTPESEAADKLVSALLTGVNRAAPFVGANDEILEYHLDTLFKIAHSTNFNTSIQALLLIQHLSTTRSLATDRFYRTLYESLLDPRLANSSKQSLYLNLLLRALKNDVDVRRVKAFAKRMLQIAGIHQPPFVCGLLYVIAHLRQTFPDLSTLIDEPEDSVFDDDDEDARTRPVYNGRKREPEFSNAQRSCLWEMIPYQAHFHPSVSVFAASLLDKDKKIEKPDLDSHSLIRFLDKFVYRNPKSTDSARGASIMQPLKATKDIGDIWLGTRGASSTVTQVNTASFWNKKVEDVAAQDVFFHEYFQSIAREPKVRAGEAAAGLEEDDEAGQEDEIYKALVSTHPDVDDEGDSDVGFDDFDEEEMASLDGSSPALSLEDDSDVDISVEGEEETDDINQNEDEGDADGFVEFNGEDDTDSEVEALPKKGNKERDRRKMLKNLPTFASVEDYAELLANEEEM